MKKIYYQKDRTKVVAIDVHKIRTYSITAMDYADANRKLVKKHLRLSKAMEKRLSKIFSSKDNKLAILSWLNDLLGRTYLHLVDFLKKNRIRLLGISAIMGMINYLILSWMKANISTLSYRVINHASITDHFMNFSMIITAFCVIFLLFLIPKKKYNVISMFVVLFADLIYFWIDKDSFLNLDKGGFYYLKIGEGVLKNHFFLALLLVTVHVISKIVYDTCEAIYKWLVGKNKSIEAPKLSLIWAIVAFLLGLLFK
ncbi:hypothetical protein [Streptococcus suis]|uniref:Uncharacterized protein n=1 Tax=Streptococcus suis TaxID=1307 RepID=A0AAW5LYW7_STRSU|nr:hypothetical protein [Streptococcus suis]MCR1233109.1 hypothetical protein [Streptococcus suis]